MFYFSIFETSYFQINYNQFQVAFKIFASMPHTDSNIYEKKIISPFLVTVLSFLYFSKIYLPVMNVGMVDIVGGILIKTKRW